MSPRVIVATAVLVLAVLTGCAPRPPHPAPSPTPSPRFTSEADGYTAAEATYRAYVDASNQVELVSPATFEPVYKLEVGDALDADKKSLTHMYSEGWTLDGDTKPGSIVRRSFTPEHEAVVALDVCMDISGVNLLDKSGHSLVRPERPDLQPLTFTFIPDSTSATGLLVSSISGSSTPCEG